MLISNNSNSSSYKDISIQSVAYGSCLSPLLSGKSLKLHSESVSFYVIKADLYIYVIRDYAQNPTDIYVYGLDRRP